MKIVHTLRENQYDIELIDEGERHFLGAITKEGTAAVVAAIVTRAIEIAQTTDRTVRRKRLQAQLAALQEEEARALQRIESIKAKRADLAARLETAEAAKR